MLGGGLSGGSPRARAPVLADLQAEYLPYAVDFRDVYRDVLENHLGAASIATVFPETQPLNTVLAIA